MTLSIADRIPCKYIVARYIEDDIRNEPINLGIIVQSQEDYEVSFKFITDYRFKSIASSVTVKKSLITDILKNIENEITGSQEQRAILDDLISRHAGKIRFSEPRGTLAEDLEDELYSLFNRYVSIPHYTELRKLPISHHNIKKTVSSFLRSMGRKVRTGYRLQGETTVNRFDIMLRDTRMIFQAISFQELRAVERAKLFDWSVKDCLAKYPRMENQFGTIISEPHQNNERYAKLRQHYDEGIKILENTYPVIKYDKRSDDWQSVILEISRSAKKGSFK
jgi:hypothetical protein